MATLTAVAAAAASAARENQVDEDMLFGTALELGRKSDHHDGAGSDALGNNRNRLPSSSSSSSSSSSTGIVAITRKGSIKRRTDSIVEGCGDEGGGTKPDDDGMQMANARRWDYLNEMNPEVLNSRLEKAGGAVAALQLDQDMSKQEGEDAFMVKTLVKSEGGGVC
jgi:hypothetical protein